MFFLEWNKKALWIGTLFLCLSGGTVKADDLVQLYREHKCEQILDLLVNINATQQNEESLYFIALCHTHNKNYDKAKDVLMELLNRDPDFYAYKIKYDLDLTKTLEQTSLSETIGQLSTGQVLASVPLKHHQLLLSSQGLFLYRNGIKIHLTDQTPIEQAGFIDDDTVYYHIGENKKKESQISIYSAIKQQTIFNEVFKKELTQIEFKTLTSQTLMQTNLGYVLFDKKTGLQKSPVTEGVYIE